MDKNRPFARLGRAGSVYHDPETTLLTEDTRDREKRSMIIFDVESNGLLMMQQRYTVCRTLILIEIKILLHYTTMMI